MLRVTHGYGPTGRRQQFSLLHETLRVKICDENLLNFSGRSGAKECNYRRCLSPCRRRVPCIPVRVILIVSSYGIPVSFALFDHFLLGSGCLGLFAFSFRLVSAWFFPVVFYLTDSKGAKECKSCRAKGNAAKCAFSRYRSYRYRGESALQS